MPALPTRPLLLAAASLSAALLIAAPTAAQRMQGQGRGGDADGNGILTRAESDAAATARFAQMDHNSDGRLSGDELGAPPPPPPPPGASDAPPRAESPRGAGMAGRIRHADANGDGAVTRDEFLALSARRFARMDANGDGSVDQAERQAMRGQMRGQMRNRRGAAGNAPADGPPADPANGPDGE